MEKVKGNIHEIPQPYLVYLGDAKNPNEAKVATGLNDWALNKVCGKIKDAYNICPQINEIAFDNSIAKTLVIGKSPFGGKLDDTLVGVIEEALERGLNVASGMHEKLIDNKKFVDLALKNNVKLYDFRHRNDVYPLGSGLKRSGIRILTVGTDCICGKKYTTLSLYMALKNEIPAVFCSTGQTGFLISNCGINNDTIPADFLSGAAEQLSPNADPSTVYLIEGQGAIRHPSFCGGAMSLLIGSQPDYLVVCHTQEREFMLNTSRKIDVDLEIQANIMCAYTHDLKPEVLALSVNSSIIKAHPKLPTFNPKIKGPIFDDICQKLINVSKNST